MPQPCDFDKMLKVLTSGQVLTGKDRILKLLIKLLTEEVLPVCLILIWLQIATLLTAFCVNHGEQVTANSRL